MKQLFKIPLIVIFSLGLSGCYLGTQTEITYPPYRDANGTPTIDDNRTYCMECASNVRKVVLTNPTGKNNEVKYEVKVEVSYHPYVKWYPSDTKGNMTENGKRAMKQDARNAKNEEDGSGGGC